MAVLLLLLVLMVLVAVVAVVVAILAPISSSNRVGFMRLTQPHLVEDTVVL
jgi:hypothetical protein